MPRYNDWDKYDRTKDKRIDVCLNCEKQSCDGNCKRMNKKIIKDLSGEVYGKE